MAYHLELLPNWRIHDVFHASLLTPYHETHTYGPNFTQPPPDLIDGEDEYKVKQIVIHWQSGQSKKLQYLIKWKGYLESDNIWEPTDQVHALQIIKHYQSAVCHQSAARSTHQSAILPTHIRTLQVKPQTPIECPMILPAFLPNAYQQTSLLKNLPCSNNPSSTSTLLNQDHSASFASIIRLAPHTPSNIPTTARSTTAPTTARLCQTALAMPSLSVYLHISF